MPLLVTLASLLGTVAAHYLFFPVFALRTGDSDLLFSVGLGICALGVYVLALTGRRHRGAEDAQTSRESPRRRTATPAKAAALFLVPGLSLLLGSWLTLINAVVIVLLFRPQERGARKRILRPL